VSWWVEQGLDPAGVVLELIPGQGDFTITGNVHLQAPGVQLELTPGRAGLTQTVSPAGVVLELSPGTAEVEVTSFVAIEAAGVDLELTPGTADVELTQNVYLDAPAAELELTAGRGHLELAVQAAEAALELICGTAEVEVVNVAPPEILYISRRGTSYGNTTGNAINASPDLPDDIQAGDRVIAFIHSTNLFGTNMPPSGWSQLDELEDVAGQSGYRMSVAYRDYDGVWTKPTWVIAAGGSDNSAVIYQVVLRRKEGEAADWAKPTYTSMGLDNSLNTSFNVSSPEPFTTHQNGRILVASQCEDPGLNITGATKGGVDLELVATGQTGTTTGTDIGAAMSTFKDPNPGTGTMAVTGTHTLSHRGAAMFFEQKALRHVEQYVEYIDGATANSTSVTIPSHEEGDLLVLFVYRSNTTAATKPTAGGTVPDWQVADTSSGSSASLIVAYAFAESSSTTTGTWTNATTMAVCVLRGADAENPIGSLSTFGENQGIRTRLPGITVEDDTGRSMIINFTCRTNSSTEVVGAAPQEWVTQESGSRCFVLTKRNTLECPQTYVNFGATGSFANNNYRTVTLELKGVPAGPPRINLDAQPCHITLEPGTAEVFVTDHKMLAPVGASLELVPGLAAVSIEQPGATYIDAPGASIELTPGTAEVDILSPNVVLVGTNEATGNSITIPTHQAGDTIVIFAFEDFGATLPTMPSAGGTVPQWNPIEAKPGTFCAMHVAWCIATDGSTTSGTWTNADKMQVAVLRNANPANPIGGHDIVEVNTGSYIDMPSITLEVDDGSSQILYVPIRAGACTWDTTPSGYTLHEQTTTNPAGAILTKDDTTTDGSLRWNTNLTSGLGQAIGATIEVRKDPTPVKLIDSVYAASTSATIPAHKAGDIIVVWAYRSGSSTPPTKPSASGTVPNWIDIDSAGGEFPASNSCRTAYCVATTSNTTTGTWTNASHLIVAVLRCQGGAVIGGHDVWFDNHATETVAPAVSMTQTDGTSALLHFVGRAGSVSSWTVPAGYTKHEESQCLFATKDVTTSDGSLTAVTNSVGQTRFAAATVEIIAH